MLKRGWSFKVIVRYALLQLPEFALVVCILFFVRRWVAFPLWIIYLISLVWVAKDVILFFFTWPAYDWNQKDTMVGMNGIVLDRLDPTGYVLVRGEKWKAMAMGIKTPLNKGQKVRVTGRQGLTLYIQPVHDPEGNNASNGCTY